MTTSEPGSAAMERTDYIAEAITAHWGERCPDNDPECFCCLAWAQYDRIADTEADLLRRHNDAVDRYEAIETLTRERDEAREALKTWQPMETAPLDREILLDVSYWYPGDRSVTACYLIGCWDKNISLWDCSEELRRLDQVNAWMDIPATTLPRQSPEAGRDIADGGAQE